MGGFFNNIGRAIENFEERQEMRREERIEQEMFLEEEEWEMEGRYFDPAMHGAMVFDPALGHHGVMYNGMWHPLDFVDGNWTFAHPGRFGVPRNYQPQNLQPPQMQSYGGGYGQPMQGGYQQQQGQGYGQQQGQGYAPAPQAAGVTCPRCHAANAAGVRFCSSCGNDLSAQSTQPAAAAGLHCTSCGAALTPGARFCSSCGHAQA